jgi:hypothetical protein
MMFFCLYGFMLYSKWKRRQTSEIVLRDSVDMGTSLDVCYKLMLAAAIFIWCLFIKSQVLLTESSVETIRTLIKNRFICIFSS